MKATSPGPAANTARETFKFTWAVTGWIRVKRNWTKDEGRSPLPTDLAPRPNDDYGFNPERPRLIPANTLIELDLVREKVSWFGLRGSHPTRLGDSCSDETCRRQIWRRG